MKLHEFRVRHPYAAFIGVVVVAVGVAGIQGCAIKDVSDLSHNNARLARENRALINRQTRIERQQTLDRAETRKRFIRSDRLLCREIEKLKARDRVAAIENHRNLDRNLRLLGIKKTPEIVKLANDTYRKVLRQTAPVKCTGLPPPAK